MRELPGGLVQILEDAFIERDVLNIVEKIQAYDENLKVQYLNPDRASSPSDPPYQIVEKCKDGEWRLVFGCWTLDELVLERLYAADMQQQDLLAAIDKKNAAIKRDLNRRYRDSMDEAKDIVEHVIKSPKGRYTIPTFEGDGVVLIDDTAPDKRIK